MEPHAEPSPRLHFHVALAGILAGPACVLVSGAAALHYLTHAPPGPERAVWKRRLLGIWLVDFLVMLAVLAFTTGLAAIPAAPVYIGVTFDQRDAGRGAQVVAEKPGSPAERAGIRPGDVITRIDGRPIERNAEATALIQSTPKGGARRLEIDRGGEKVELTVTPSASSSRPQVAVPLFQRDEQAGIGLSGSAGLAAELVVVGVPLAILLLVGRRGGPPAPRSPLRFWLAFMGVLASSIVALIAVTVGLQVALGGPTLGGSLLGVVSGSAVLLTGAAFLRERLDRAGEATIAWGHAPALGTIWLGIGYLLAGALRCGIILNAATALLRFPKVDPGREIRGLLGGTPSGVALALLILAAVVLAPIGEETLFRGVLLPWLGRWMRPGTALWVSSVLFGVAHLRYGIYMVQLIVYGLVLGWARLRTGSLRASIALHMIINATALLVGLRAGAP